jgi:hypothetical protein
LSAKVVTELAKAAEIQAAVLLHPSLLSVDDMKGIVALSKNYDSKKC